MVCLGLEAGGRSPETKIYDCGNGSVIARNTIDHTATAKIMPPDILTVYSRYSNVENIWRHPPRKMGTTPPMDQWSGPKELKKKMGELVTEMEENYKDGMIPPWWKEYAENMNPHTAVFRRGRDGP